MPSPWKRHIQNITRFWNVALDKIRGAKSARVGPAAADSLSDVWCTMSCDKTNFLLYRCVCVWKTMFFIYNSPNPAHFMWNSVFAGFINGYIFQSYGHTVYTSMHKSIIGCQNIISTNNRSIGTLETEGFEICRHDFQLLCHVSWRGHNRPRHWRYSVTSDGPFQSLCQLPWNYTHHIYYTDSLLYHLQSIVLIYNLDWHICQQLPGKFILMSRRPSIASNFLTVPLSLCVFLMVR